MKPTHLVFCRWTETEWNHERWVAGMLMSETPTHIRIARNWKPSEEAFSYTVRIAKADIVQLRRWKIPGQEGKK